MRDAGAPGDLAQPEAGEALGVQDVDGAVDQPLPGVDEAGRGHVDSVHHRWTLSTRDQVTRRGGCPAAAAQHVAHERFEELEGQ